MPSTPVRILHNARACFLRAGVAILVCLSCLFCLTPVGSRSLQANPPSPEPPGSTSDAPPSMVDPEPASPLELTAFQPEPEGEATDDDVPTIEPQRVVGTAEQNGPAEPSVVTPTRTEMPASRFGGTVRVITSEEIRQSNETTVSELLRRVPGVDVVQSGPQGGLTSVFLRGANSQHTKVLMDGIPLNDPSNASRLFDFGNMLLDNVEQIEVLQGPQSILYGSDAIGGVINIVTKRGEGPMRVGVSAMGGSLGTHREQARIQGGTSLYHYSVTGSWNQTDGFSAAAPRVGGVERDGFRAGAVTGRFGWTPSEDFEAEYTFRWVNSRAEVDDAPFSLGTPPTDDLFRLNLSEAFYNRVQLRRAMWDDLLVHQVSFSLADYDRRDTDDMFPARFLGQTRKFLYQADLLVTDSNVLSAGADYTAEDGESIDTFGGAAATQNLRGVFIQDQIQWMDRWFTTAGLRWDDHNVAGRANTYRFTSLFDIWETGTRVRGSLGTGFRAPSLAENLFPFGNPDLRPETSRGWEYGLDQSWFDGELTMGVTYFRNDIRNLILFDLDTFVLENIGVARTHGMEVTGFCQLTPVLTLQGSYTLTNTRDEEFDRPLVRRPRNKGTMLLTRRLWNDQASLSLQGIFIGERTDARDGSVVLDPYTLFHLSGDYFMNPDTRLFLRVHNLFNERYEEITGFGTQPLTAFAGVDWRM
jgi:vitamin B12 transporter